VSTTEFFTASEPQTRPELDGYIPASNLNFVFVTLTADSELLVTGLALAKG
jgi:hypothetical protein